MRPTIWRSQLRHSQRLRCVADHGALERSSIASRTVRTANRLPTPCVQRRHASASAAAAAPVDENDAVVPEPKRTPSRIRGRTKEPASNGLPPAPPIPDWFLAYNVSCFELVDFKRDQYETRVLVLQDPYEDIDQLSIPLPDLTTETWMDKPAAASAGDKPANAHFPIPIPQTGAVPVTREETGDTHVPGEETGAGIPVARTEVTDPEADGDTASPEPSFELRAAALVTAMSRLKQDARKYFDLQGHLLCHAILNSARRSEAKQGSRNLIVLDTNRDSLDEWVEATARLTGADLIRLDAGDIAELAGEYVDSARFGHGTIAGLAYDTYEGAKALHDRGPSSAPRHSSDGADDAPIPEELQQLQELLEKNGKRISEALEKMDSLERATGKPRGVGDGGPPTITGFSFGSLAGAMRMPISMRSDEDDQQQTKSGRSKAGDPGDMPTLDRWQQMKLRTFFDQILSSVQLKKERDLSNVAPDFVRETIGNLKNRFRHPAIRRELSLRGARPQIGLTQIELDRIRRAGAVLVATEALQAFGHSKPAQIKIMDSEHHAPWTPTKSAGTIVHLRDIHLIHETPHGEEIVRQLQRAVQARQKNGEAIMIIATSADLYGDVTTPLEDMEADDLGQENAFVRLSIKSSEGHIKSQVGPPSPAYPAYPADPLILELNLRNAHTAILRLGMPCSPNFFNEIARPWLYAPLTAILSESVMTAETIERIVLMAEGFRAIYTTSETLELPHLAYAVTILQKVLQSNVQDETRTPKEPSQQGLPGSTTSTVSEPSSPKKTDGERKPRLNIEELRRLSSKHEQRLLPGVVDPASIKVTYDDVHVAKETIQSLKTVTTLALLRPEAFSYGVLASDRLPGLMLYGPPGTGKTLLAKAVAKDASATVLEVSGAQVYEKYVGEGEKMVNAVFSLAKRLSPCVVFIDEADALFGSRGQSGNRTTHREIINQFLRGWDGMDDHRVFMMVATNRPFDLDEAVLRRLPRRILVDLPTAKDREAILRIHLKGEQLHEEVNVEKLSASTPFYSGSDLKNVCVAAALAAVNEESELLQKHKGDDDFKLPARRTLRQTHFDKAIQEISASISEDMTTLSQIRKFDERYGDRKGRKKKKAYGFSPVDAKQDDEGSARVREDADNPRP